MSAGATTGVIKAGSVSQIGNDIWRMQTNGHWQIKGSALDTFVLTNDGEDDIISTMENTDTTKKKSKKEVATPLIPSLDKYMDAGFNVLLIGPHGTGKTQSILDLAKVRGFKMKYYSCSTLDPFTDLVGVPVPTDEYDADGNVIGQTLKMVRPKEVDEAEVIFFDEFNRADPKTLNAIFEIIQFKSINGEPLKNLKVCWAAMNPPDENYDVERLDPALLDRFDLYLEVLPKPSIAYMATKMPLPIAKALYAWWNDHERKLNASTKKKDQSLSDYVSPRRLEKIGLVWCATKTPRAIHNVMPLGGNFDKQKLIEILKTAQQHVDGGTEPDESDWAGTGIGDKAADFTYTPAAIRLDSTTIVDYLTKNPAAHETHAKVVVALKQGVGGQDLVKLHSKVLNAINPAALEGMVNSFPAAKVSQMRSGFATLYTENKATASKLKTLHAVLAKGARDHTDFPKTL